MYTPKNSLDCMPSNSNNAKHSFPPFISSILQLVKRNCIRLVQEAILYMYCIFIPNTQLHYLSNELNP